MEGGRTRAEDWDSRLAISLGNRPENEQRPATGLGCGRNSTALFRQVIDLEIAVKKILRKCLCDVVRSCAMLCECMRDLGHGLCGREHGGLDHGGLVLGNAIGCAAVVL